MKRRPGSRKGQTRFVPSAYKAAKKRSGQIGKSTARKQRVLHDAMRGVWDEKETPATNLQRLGLVSEINKVNKSAVTTERVVQLTNSGTEDTHMSNAERADCESVRTQLENHAGMPERGTKQIVRPGERVALEKLVAKYGKNWNKMAKDLKLNYLQWTPAQLRKKVERMQSLLRKN